MSATKRIPVSEETWRQLNREKEPGQTWDELLEQIWIQAKKNRTAKKAKKAKEDNLETVEGPHNWYG